MTDSVVIPPTFMVELQKISVAYSIPLTILRETFVRKVNNYPSVSPYSCLAALNFIYSRINQQKNHNKVMEGGGC